jgi:hypothetical protein
MNKKVRIYLLFLLLAITPFCRGCDASYGFPFPTVAGDANNVFKDLAAIVSVKSFMPVAFFVVNILVACLLAMIFLRKRENLKWGISLERSLNINLFAIWILLLLGSALDFILGPKGKLPKAIDSLLEIYGNLLWWVYYTFPSFITKKICSIMHLINNRYEPSDLFYEFMPRAWLVIVILLLTGLLYLISRIRRK